MKDLSQFIERLVELMHEKNLNIYSLSKQIKCDHKAIRRWFKNQYYPRYYILINLADYFGVAIDYLLGLTNDDSYSPSTARKTFLDRFRFCMENKNYSAYRVAKICGIERSTIYYWTKYNKMPETETLILLAKCFNCSIDFLLGRTDE